MRAIFPLVNGVVTKQGRGDDVCMYQLSRVLLSRLQVNPPAVNIKFACMMMMIVWIDATGEEGDANVDVPRMGCGPLI